MEVCDSGHDALGLAESFRPDLILLDVMMPGMDGPATLTALRRTPHGSEVPVIFMTAKVQPQEVEAYRDLGVRRTPHGSEVPVIFMTAKVQPQEVEAYRDLGYST